MNHKILEKIQLRKRELSQHKTIMAALIRQGAPQFKIDHCQNSIDLIKSKIEFLNTQFRI